MMFVLQNDGTFFIAANALIYTYPSSSARVKFTICVIYNVRALAAFYYFVSVVFTIYLYNRLFPKQNVFQDTMKI